MRTNLMSSSAPRRLALLAVLAVTASACSVEKQTAPSLIGPSGHALSLVLQASPDLLPRDGASESVVTVTARDASGAPIPNLRLVTGASPNATGLSGSEVVTNSNGQAQFSVVAPPSSTVAANNQILVTVVPMGDNFANSASRSLSIGLLGPSNSTVPTADFTIAPENPEVLQIVVFDASASTDEGVTCDACSFGWSFGDGSSASGRIVTHSFAAGGTFAVTLTVTDSAGTSGTAVKTIEVGAPEAPAAEFVVSPADADAGETVFFDASTSTVGVGASIVEYTWNFGDGTVETSSSPRASHAFGASGTYAVVLTIRDSLNRTNSVTESVDIN